MQTVWGEAGASAAHIWSRNACAAFLGPRKACTARLGARKTCAARLVSVSLGKGVEEHISVSLGRRVEEHISVSLGRRVEEHISVSGRVEDTSQYLGLEVKIVELISVLMEADISV